VREKGHKKGKIDRIGKVDKLRLFSEDSFKMQFDFQTVRSGFDGFMTSFQQFFCDFRQLNQSCSFLTISKLF
jgi:hypothetical protein